MRKLFDGTLKPIIAVDGDGTLFVDKFPALGNPNRVLIASLRFMQHTFGARVVLWSCRVDKDLNALVEACKWEGLYFDAVNENLPDVVAKFGQEGRKIFAHVYIDDRAGEVMEVLATVLAELMEGEDKNAG